MLRDPVVLLLGLFCWLACQTLESHICQEGCQISPCRLLESLIIHSLFCCIVRFPKMKEHCKFTWCTSVPTFATWLEVGGSAADAPSRNRLHCAVALASAQLGFRSCCCLEDFFNHDFQQKAGTTMAVVHPCFVTDSVSSCR